jgi:hypothetical protein
LARARSTPSARIGRGRRPGPGLGQHRGDRLPGGVGGVGAGDRVRRPAAPAPGGRRSRPGPGGPAGVRRRCRAARGGPGRQPGLLGQLALGRVEQVLVGQDEPTGQRPPSRVRSDAPSHDQHRQLPSSTVSTTGRR